MAKRGVYRMALAVGRMGTANGLFTATDDEVAGIIGKKVYLGDEVYFGGSLGVQAGVSATISAGDVVLVTDDGDFVEKFDRLKCASGHNPLAYAPGAASDDDAGFH